MTRMLLAVAGAALVATLVLGAFWAAPAVEDDVRDRVTATIAGLPDVSVEVDGRDVRLSGPLPAGVTREQTLAAVSSIDAVRSVTDGGLGTSGSGAGQATVSITVTITARDAEVAGTVLDRDQLATLLEALQRTAPTVVSRLVVADAAPSAEADGQIDALAGLLGAAGTDVGVGTVTLADGRMIVTTSVPDVATRDRLARLIDATGLGSSTSVTVTVGPPGSGEADPEGDQG